MNERIPPHSLEAEEALLGAALCDAEIMDAVVTLLQPADFYAHVHESIFEAMIALHKKNQRTDRISVAERLKTMHRLEDVGGMAYLSHLMDTVQTVESAVYYATIIAEKSKLREQIKLAASLLGRAYDEANDPDDLMREYVPKLEDVSLRGRQIQVCSIAELNEILDQELGQIYPTPYPALNRRMGGLRKRNLVTLSAANRIGKTAFVLGMADFYARHYGPVAIFTLEMEQDELHGRLISMYSGVPLLRKLQGPLSESDQELWDRAALALEDVPLRYISPSKGRMWLRDVAVMTRRMQREYPDLFGIVVDHVRELGDVRRRGKRSEHEALEDVYHGLRELAREQNICSMAVVHQNRDAGDKRPTLYDQKGGGNPEEIADVALLLHRPKVDGTKNETRKAEVIIAKARNARAGPCEFEFIGARGLWIDASIGRPWWEPPPPVQPDLLAEAESAFGVQA